jgi:hypothetical protein
MMHTSDKEKRTFVPRREDEKRRRNNAGHNVH